MGSVGKIWENNLGHEPDILYWGKYSAKPNGQRNPIASKREGNALPENNREEARKGG